MTVPTYIMVIMGAQAVFMATVGVILLAVICCMTHAGEDDNTR